MKSQKQLESFTAYCQEHPELRFWQALCNWSGYSRVYGEKTYNKGSLSCPIIDDGLDGQEVLEDTYYKD